MLVITTDAMSGKGCVTSGDVFIEGLTGSGTWSEDMMVFGASMYTLVPSIISK